jgi:hypothetical protein
MNNLNRAIRFFFLGSALSGLALATPLAFDRGLPTSANVNGSPAARSNEAWLTGTFTNGGNSYQLAGDDFSFAANGIIGSITVFEVANNNVGDGASSLPTSEFSSITLYEGTNAAAGTTGISAVSSSYSFAQVSYQPGSVNFIDQNGNAFPIYALTFSGLNLAVTSGTLYDFAVDATANPGGCVNSPFADPCILALHGTNAALAGDTQQGSDNQYRTFTLAGGKATFQSFCEITCQEGNDGVATIAPTDINVQVTFAAVPEPATWSTLAAGLGGLMLFARKRRK